nr:MAG TPA: hypothetical protein [Bacteriophage sp.]
MVESIVLGGVANPVTLSLRPSFIQQLLDVWLQVLRCEPQLPQSSHHILT